MLQIESVAPGSCAAELELEAGDQLLQMNGSEVGDLIDYHRLLEQSQLQLVVLRQDEMIEAGVEKEPQEDLGLCFVQPPPRQCGNQCQFCFVHQLPKGLRRTLYIKDEDYRFSYLYGSYITLTNLDEADFQRIIELQLSPLYVSVHATDPQLREKLLGRPVPDINQMIERLTAGGIELHCQVVLCPGLNDGAALDETIHCLASNPRILSLAVVPVGLTQFRQHLPQLEQVSPDQAAACLQLIERCQQEFLPTRATRFVFAADEFYLKAGIELPATDSYEDFAQFENGVGMIASFRQQAEDVLLDAEPLELERVTLVSGRSFAPELQRFAERLQLRTGVTLDVKTISNDFFGPAISVTGLLTGQDLIAQLEGLSLGDAVLIPEVCLKQGDAIFLDDMALDELQQQLGVPVLAVESSPWGVLDGLEQLSDQGPEIIHC